MAQDAQPVEVTKHSRHGWHGVVTKETMPQWWRRLAAFFWVVGMVGLAWYIEWTCTIPLDGRLFIEDVSMAYHTRAVNWLRYFPATQERQIERQVGENLQQHAAAWAAWYYNVFNIRYWSVALLCFAP